ncbi:MAG: cytochrome c peroxidase [Pseudomonadota bacterium]
MTRKVKGMALLAALSTVTACGGGGGGPDPADLQALKAELGGRIFADTNLSEPAGQACASCHVAQAGFADPDTDSTRPVSEGAVAGRFGNRNAPTVAYASLTPVFGTIAAGEYVGGQFVDGRAATLEQQAMAPFLNPLEMANPDKSSVIDKIRAAGYAALFEQVYGAASLDDAEAAFDRVADALAAFESTPALSPFTSKFDYFLAGQAQLTAQERRGFILFDGKGLCFTCHESPLFTNHAYSNIGVPKNPDNPFYTMPPEFNPAGTAFVDLGLGLNPTVLSTAENGKFRVPTLRNVALTAPYMHNGVFQTLDQVVNFYNTRDVLPACPTDSIQQDCWPQPEVAENMDTLSTGNLGLTPSEVSDLVAFLNTLTDGYVP